jgi:hypothetical protein
MSKEYALCPHCQRSNPIEDPDLFEQTCIFCGKPFMIPNEKETQLISKPVKDQKNRIPEEVQPNQLEDVNQTKPVNRNRSSPLR